MKALLALTLLVSATFAHFEVIYTPSVEVTQKEVTLTNFFSHPYDGHFLMTSGVVENGDSLGIEKFLLVHKGETTNLSKNVTNVTYSTTDEAGKTVTAPGYDITLNKKVGFRSAGDYAVVIVPHPYFEPSEGEEGIYIQQITKLFVNKGGMGEGWMQRQLDGYTEIIPLVRPYDLTVGSLFRGVVLDNAGKPVAGAVVEVEYLNYPIDMQNHTFSGKAHCSNPKKGIATLVTDVNGIFAFIPQKEGYWGFAALSAGSDKEYKGKELEQDPVLWINVAQ